MAKTAHAQTPAVVETEQQLVPRDQSSLPAFMDDVGDDIVGLGNSSDPNDQSLPFLGILQSGSPQVKEEDAKYIDGAKPGFILNTGTKQFYAARVSKGEDGVLAIPCGYQKKWVEWKPARGGFVQNYPFSIELLKELGARKSKIIQEGKEREVITVPSGNLLVETAYTFLLIDGVPAVLGASSSALGPMRDWMNYRNSLRDARHRIRPSFSKVYRLRTVIQTKDQNSWHNWKIDDAGYVTDETLWNLAKDFAIAVDRDEVQLGRPDYFTDESSSSDHGEARRPSANPDDDSIPV
jgi:hypothetical protein